MSVYMIIDSEVLEPERYAEYVSKARTIVESHGGRYLAQGGAITPIAGDWNPQRIVIIEFPSMDQFRTCFASKEYGEISHLREGSMRGRVIAVEGE